MLIRLESGLEKSAQRLRASAAAKQKQRRAVELLTVLAGQKRGGVDGLTSFTPFLPDDAPGRFAVRSGAQQSDNRGFAAPQGVAPASAEAGNSPSGAKRQKNVGRDGGTFMDLAYGARFPGSRGNSHSPARALNVAVDEIHALAKEHYPEYYRNGQIIPEFGDMIPEVGAEIIELPSGRYSYVIVIGRSDGRGNGSVSWRLGDPDVAGRVHFHWTNDKPSGQDESNAISQYNTRNQDRDYIESIGTYGGHRTFFYLGKIR